MNRGGGGDEISFGDIICLENLFSAWNEFKKGKQQKRDVQIFALDVEDHLFKLYHDLVSGQYGHSPYTSFFVCDPKRRHIHKPSVRDRVLHHAIVRAIEPDFDPHFIFHSYSSRQNKGTHRAVARLRKMAWRICRNDTRTVWIVHGDIRKFFDSVDHTILLRLIQRRIGDTDLLELIEKIVRSFEVIPGKGIPLGNLTSQLFSNIYLDHLDQYVVNLLGEKRYIRYADDFVIISRNKLHLECLIQMIRNFLEADLQLTLHPKKLVFKKWHQGVDFLGYVSFPRYTILRTKTKRRIFQHIKIKHDKLQQGLISQNVFDQTIQSYLGMLKHCQGRGIKKRLKNSF